MTVEPKFVPEDAVSVSFSDNTELSVRLIDCVGYMVDGAAGQFEDGSERMVTTPWFDHEVSITDAAEQGTYKVISEHSTLGLVITTDGSICDIPREKYLPAEERVIRELQEIGKPFVVVLNSADPDSDTAVQIAGEISQKYDVKCLRLNCLTMSQEDIGLIIQSVLEEFPLQSIGIFLPEWFDALKTDEPLRAEIQNHILQCCGDVLKLKECGKAAEMLSENEKITRAEIKKMDLGTGTVTLEIQLPRSLYYQTISEETGLDIRNDADLIAILADMSSIKKDYEHLRSALEDVRTKGYGVVMPDSSQMRLEEPQIVRQGGKYTVKLKANAPAIHMMMTNVETEVTPAIGGETASEDIINFLLQGFDGDVNRIWQSNIFGKSLNDIAEEGLTAKLQSIPENARNKLQNTLQRIINDGSNGLICILF